MSETIKKIETALSSRWFDKDTPTPRNDMAFKLLFSDERNQELLKDFLLSIIKLPEEEFDSITIPDPHLLREFVGDKLGILDVKILTKSGTVIAVDIQISPDPFMRQRIEYYKSKLVIEQVGIGAYYDRIQPIISIAIVDFVMFPEDGNYHNRFIRCNPDNGLVFSPYPETHILELPKISKDSDGTALYNWAQFLNARTKEELNVAAQTNPNIQKAVWNIARMTADEKARELLELREKWERDRLFFAKQQREEGAREGRQEGRQQERREIASQMIRDKIPIEAVAKYTGFTVSELEALRP